MRVLVIIILLVGSVLTVPASKACASNYEDAEADLFDKQADEARHSQNAGDASLVYKKYFTANHPKAKGLDIGIKYPESWKLVDGGGPNVVQKFVGDPSVGYSNFAILMVLNPRDVIANDLWVKFEKLSMDDSSEMLASVMSTESFIKSITPPNVRFISGSQSRYAGNPGVCIIYISNSEIAGKKVEMHVVNYMIFYKKKFISIQGFIGGIAGANDYFSIFQNHQTIYSTMVNSIEIDDASVATIPPTATHRSNSNPELLLFSLFLTWSLGLLPPVLLRFVIMRKPFENGLALAVVILFWCFNTILFIWIGSQSRSHAALLAVAWASYLILRKSKSKRNAPNGWIENPMLAKRNLFGRDTFNQYLIFLTAVTAILVFVVVLKYALKIFG